MKRMVPIIIVDDSRGDADLAMRMLQQCKVLNPISCFSSGAECISYFEEAGSHTAGTLPCLVLLDLSMQPVSGIDVLRTLQQHPNAADSIFVMLSGISDLNIIREGYSLGAKTFLVKPLHSEDVLQMIQAVPGIVASRQPEGYVISLTGIERPPDRRRTFPDSRSLSA